MQSLKDRLPDPVRGRDPYRVIAEQLALAQSAGEMLTSWANAPALVLVPVPRSSLHPDEPFHWPAREIARALVERGIGERVVELLERWKPVAKSATGGPRNAHTHSQSLRPAASFPPTNSVLLVDDIITSGATVMGAALCLQRAFPGIGEVGAFAAMRTVTEPSEFEHIRDPAKGSVHLREDGLCRRRP